MQNLDGLASHPFSATVDLKKYIQLLWQWAWLLVLCILTAGSAAYFVSNLSVPIYQTSLTLLVDQGATMDYYYASMYTEQVASTYAQIIQRSETLAKVAEKLGIDPKIVNDGITSVQVTPIRDTQLLKVTIEGVWPEVIVAVANTIPAILVEEIKQIKSGRFTELEANLQRQINELAEKIETDQIKIDDIGESHTPEEEVQLGRLKNDMAQSQAGLETLRQSLENVRLTEAQSTDHITVIQSAQLPEQPIRPRVLTNTLLAAVVGAMLALGIIFLIDYLDDRIKTPQALRQLVNVPILGTIGRIPGKKAKDGIPDQALITVLQPRHPITEAYRSLRTNLQFSSIDITLDSLLLTSSEPGEGKTTSAANLATILAQAGRRVLLIDADLRKPMQHRLFKVSQQPGLTEALVNSDSPVEEYIRPTIIPNLHLLTSGNTPPNPAELLGSQRMATLLQKLHEVADILIIDAPPLLPVTDAYVLANQVKGVLLVVNANKTQRTSLLNALESLQHAQANLLGFVFNDMARLAFGYYQATKSTYTYIAEANKAQGTLSSKAPPHSEPQNVRSLTPITTLKGRLPLAERVPTQPDTNGVYALQQEKLS